MTAATSDTRGSRVAGFRCGCSHSARKSPVSRWPLRPTRTCLVTSQGPAEVTGLSLAPATSPNMSELVGVEAGMAASVYADVRDPRSVDASIRDSDPEIVFHLAGQSLVWASYREPVETFATNVMGTVHLLDAVRRSTGVRAVVIVTTDKC